MKDGFSEQSEQKEQSISTATAKKGRSAKALAELSSTATSTSERPTHPPAPATLATAQRALRIAVDQKALDPVVIDLRGLSSVADLFVIASGTSQRHLQGMSDKIELSLKERGERPNSVNGFQDGDWIILDYGDVVVHLLHEPARQYYNLDGLWRDAPRLPLEPELEEQVRRLRTGSIR